MAAAIEYGPEDPSFSRSLITNHDVLIFDFGLDAASLPSSNVARITDWPRDQRYRLGAIARCLASCAEECHTVSRSTPSSSLPDFLVVNPNHHPFDQFVSQFLLTTKTPYNTRVRKGRARVGDERLYRSHRWKLTEETMQSFFGYDLQDGSVPPLAPGDSIDFTSLASSSRYKDGNWGVADHTGTWIDGPEAVVLLSIDPAVEADLIAHVYVTETFLGPEELPISCERVVRGRAHSEMVVRISLRLLHFPADPSAAAFRRQAAHPSRVRNREPPVVRGRCPASGGGDDRRGPA